MPELGSLGSVRGVLSNEHPYRECVIASTEGRPGTAIAHLISGARGAIWPFAGPSASTVVSA